jgi:hypothetical protein
VPGRGAAARVGAVGHLEPAADVGKQVPAVEQIGDGAAVPELDVGGLPAAQQPRPRHDVGRRDPAGLRPLNAVAPGIDGVEDADIGMQAGRPVPTVAAADVGVRVHQARHDHLAGQIVHVGAGGRADGGPGADRRDPAILDDEYAVVDGRADDGDDARALEHLRPGLPRKQTGPQGREREREGSSSLHAVRLQDEDRWKTGHRARGIYSPAGRNVTPETVLRPMA